MKLFLKYSFLFILTGLLNRTYSQNSLEDLYKKLKNATQDTTKLRLRSEIGETAPILRFGYWDSIAKDASTLYSTYKNTQIKILESHANNNIGYILFTSSKPKEAFSYYATAVTIIESMLKETDDKKEAKKLKKEIANTINNIGASHEELGNNREALECYSKSVAIQEEIHDTLGLATALNNLGLLYNKQGYVEKAIDCYERALKLNESKGINTNLGTVINNLGLIYSEQGDQASALKYYLRSAEIQEKLGNKKGFCVACSNIGSVYRFRHDSIKALFYYRKSLEIAESIADKHEIANVFNYLGIIYFSSNMIEKAIYYYEKSLELRKAGEAKRGIAEALRNLGMCYNKLAVRQNNNNERQKYLKIALRYADSSSLIARQLGFPTNISEIESTLAGIYEAMDNYNKAFEHYKQYIIFRDSIANENNRKAGIKNQLKYEFAKKEAVIKEQQDRERAIAEEKSRFQQIVIGVVIIGLILVLIFAAFIFRTLRLTSKQKLIIEQKQSEILDSIHYAKKIQSALMTSEKYIDRELNRLKEH